MKNYEMITVKKFFEDYEVKVTNISEKEIFGQVERYLLNQKRNETNAKIVEALLA